MATPDSVQMFKYFMHNIGMKSNTNDIKDLQSIKNDQFMAETPTPAIREVLIRKDHHNHLKWFTDKVKSGNS